MADSEYQAAESANTFQNDLPKAGKLNNKFSQLTTSQSQDLLMFFAVAEIENVLAHTPRN